MPDVSAVMNHSSLRPACAVLLVVGALLTGMAVLAYLFPTAVCSQSPCSSPPPSWNYVSLSVFYLGVGLTVAGTGGIVAGMLARRLRT
jgi:hypothetical protein